MITEIIGVPNLTETGYTCIRYMGACNGGHIYLGRSNNMRNRQFVAIKKFSLDDIEEYDEIAKETANLRLLKHENILELTENFVYEKAIYQITPAINLGSLFDIVFEYKKWGINEKSAVVITRQILEALVYLHQRRYIHRNIKTKHILLDSNGRVKLSGFRYMIELNYHLDCVFDYDNHLHGQIYYLAPEVLAQNMPGYTTKSDIYMLGITICEAVNGCMPFSELVPLEMLYRKMNGQVPRPVDKSSLEDDKKMGLKIDDRPKEHCEREFSKEMHNFISNCLTEPKERRSAAEQLKSAWLSKREHKNLGPADLSKELRLDYNHFDLSQWIQEPVMPPEPEQRYEIAFDYSALS
ncbi:unnamed protein product [Caenorhabditis brenneri]